MKCPRCDGEGHFFLVLKPRSLGPTRLHLPSEKVTCPDCKGTGKI